MADIALPRLRVSGTGIVLYRCAGCGDLMLPEYAVLVDGVSWHLSCRPVVSDGS